MNAEQLAKLFHGTYERLAPVFSYQTRKASAVPWEQVPENNKRLMIAVCEYVLGVYMDDLDLHEVCVIAANLMIADGAYRHITYVAADDNITFDMPNGKVPKITIEWVDEAETLSDEA